MDNKHYDVIIVGGGLAGLSLSILLAKQNYAVLLLEKRQYPFHKVCGEYISNESKPFLLSLGIDINPMQLPGIQQLELTSVEGKVIHQPLDLGGFGISRYTLDNLLFQTALQNGVTVLTQTTFEKYEKQERVFNVFAGKQIFTGKILCGSYGKYNCGNFKSRTPEKINWVGVKYHIKMPWPKNKIALHTFEGGYCGISAIEGDTCCLCYIIDAEQFKRNKNQIDLLENQVLRKNKYLNEIFEQAHFVFDKPEVISNVTLQAKQPTGDGVFYIGDSAGTIAPLTGNGMSNAMRSASLLNKVLQRELSGDISHEEAIQTYTDLWNRSFKNRMKLGNWIHHFFCKPRLTRLLFRFVSISGLLRRIIVKNTHGEVF